MNTQPQHPMTQVPSVVAQPSYSPDYYPPSYGQTVNNFSDIANMFTASSMQKPVSIKRKATLVGYPVPFALSAFQIAKKLIFCPGEGGDSE